MLGSIPALTASIAVLQAGGGGSFGGGGGGSGGGFGGGGDGDGLFWIVYMLIRLAIEVPLLGIPLLIGVAAVFVMGTRKGWWKHQERIIRRSTPKRIARVSRVMADVLKRSDPSFDETRFLARVRTAFERAQTAWCAQDLEPLRPFVSDGVFERFSLQIEEQREDGWRQGMEGTRIGEPVIAHVEAGEAFDTVTVRIPFRSDIHRIDLATGERIRGSKLPRTTFAECWSFVRRGGAKSFDGAGLLEGQCPNCGARLSLNQSARCESCEALVKSGQFDWVLTEITQASEWSAEHEVRVPGLAAYRERDPGLSVQLLEDRASVAFWRLAAAERAGRVDALTKVADEAFCERFTREHAPGARTTFADRAVGSVRTLGLVPGTERDRALVEVVWDGRRARVQPNGERELEKPRRLHRTIFEFSRAPGQRTELDASLTTAHCDECGAHDPGGTGATCPYCDAPRRGGPETWLVSGVWASGSDEARRLRAELATSEGAVSASAVRPAAVSDPASEAADSPGTLGLLTWLGALVRADGVVSDRERRAIGRIADQAGVDPERVDAAIRAPADAVPEPRDSLEARRWIDALIGTALADGSLSKDERRFLRDAAVHLGIGKGELDHRMRDVRSRLFRESRAR